MSATRSRSRVRRTWPQRLLIAFNVGLIVTSLTVAGGLGYLNLKLDEIPRLELGDTLSNDGDEPAGAPQNYLIVGTDSAERLDEGDSVKIGRENVGLNSDTIMLLRVDPGDTQAQLLSFPRDLFVTIPGAGEAKINQALNTGGPELLIETIKTNFDVPVDHYLELDFRGFQELVAAVDGIPLYFDTPVRDPQTGLNIERAGCKVLEPDRALAYARARSLEYYDEAYGGYRVDGSGDLGRISRQQDFIRKSITRAVEKGATNPVTLSALVDVAVDNVRVDENLKAGDILALGKRFRNFNAETLNTMTFNVLDDNVYGQSVLRLTDDPVNNERLEIFRGGGGDAGSIQLVVQNGSGTSGQGSLAQEQFAALGFSISGIAGDADRFDYATSVVRYEDGFKAQAEYVAKQIIGGADTEMVGVDQIEGANIAVVTGQDFQGTVDALDGRVPNAPGGGGNGGGGGGGGEGEGDPNVTTTTVNGEVPQAPEGVDCG